MTASHEELKARQRAERDEYSENLTLRVHRALSWLDRAEREPDPDSRFIFLWIAFNAAYATEIDERYSLDEQVTFNEFVRKLHALDRARKRLDELVWTTYPQTIRLLLGNRYVFMPFWGYRQGRITEADWKRKFAAARKAANHALANQNTPAVLAIVLGRVYTLRNQIIHGGATWSGSVNRAQIRDGVALLGDFIPLVIEIMMDHPDTLWGAANYPVVEE